MEPKFNAGDFAMALNCAISPRTFLVRGDVNFVYAAFYLARLRIVKKWRAVCCGLTAALHIADRK